MQHLLWEDVHVMHKEFTMKYKRLRWVVNFAFLSWDVLSTGKKLDVYAGLLAFAPEFGNWTESTEGWVSSVVWHDKDILALQQQLQLFFKTVVGERLEEFSVVLPSLLWYQSKPFASFEQKEVVLFNIVGQKKADIVVAHTALLVRDFPDNIIQCKAPSPYRRPGICGKIFYGRLDRRWCDPTCMTRWHRALKLAEVE